MALHTLKELHDKTAEHIIALINKGFKIDPSRSTSDDPKRFNVVLTKDVFTVEIHTAENDLDNIFTRLFIISNSIDSRFNNKFCAPYYKAHDDIYADTEDEAKDERNKWLAKGLGVNPKSKNPIQDFADMLGKINLLSI